MQPRGASLTLTCPWPSRRMAGLLTPVLRGVDGLTLTAISEAIADLAERARRGRLQQQEL